MFFFVLILDNPEKKDAVYVLRWASSFSDLSVQNRVSNHSCVASFTYILLCHSKNCSTEEMLFAESQEAGVDGKNVSFE